MPILKNLSLENGPVKLNCIWSNILTRNETHTMILVCAADDFRKYQNIRKIGFSIKNHKKICHKQNVKCLVFINSAGQVCYHKYLNLIKLHSKLLFSSKS